MAQDPLIALDEARKKLLIIGWYDKDDLADIIDDNITDEEFQYILDNYSPFEDIRDSVINDVSELLGEIRTAKLMKKKEVVK